MILLAAILILDGTIEDQLRALRADDIERRVAAAESLVELGEAALEALRVARREAVDSESRARLDDVIARIERGRFSDPVAGVAAALTPRWDGERDQMVFTIELLNVGEETQRIVQSDAWDVAYPRLAWRSRINAVRLDVRTIPDTPPGSRRIFSTVSCGCAAARARIALKPGEIARSELRLSRGSSLEEKALPSGRYQARAAYYARHLAPGTETDLETPWVEFTVP